MLYASSREDIKKNLGLSYFVSGKGAEYYANEVSDLCYATYVQSMAVDDAPLNARETALKQEQDETRMESAVVKSSAMGAIPFHLDPGLAAQLQAFKDGTVNWLEMILEIDTETVKLVQAHTLTFEGR